MAAAAAAMRQALAKAGSPCFRVAARSVRPMASPTDFYERLLESIATARRTLHISALYLGTGPMEQAVVAALDERLSRRDGLRATLLLDYSRANRRARDSTDPARSSKEILAPLVEAHGGEGGALRVGLFRMPQLEHGLASYLRTPFDEGYAVSHLKAIVADDDVRARSGARRGQCRAAAAPPLTQHGPCR